MTRGTSAIALVLVAAVSGALCALAFPPFDQAWIVWFALTPFLWAVWRSRSTGQAALVGLAWGFTFIMVTTRPLISAATWTGWGTVTTSQLATIHTRIRWFLSAMWILISLWAGGLFHAAYAVALRRIAGRRLPRFLVVAPALWPLVEWLRSLGTWSAQWAFLGNTVADYSYPRQLAAVGGVLLVGFLVVAVNAALLVLILDHHRKRWWLAPAAVGSIVVLVLAGGALRVHWFAPEEPGIRAAALQHHRSEYTSKDFTPFGLDISYLQLVYQIAGRHDAGAIELLVLPESVGYGALSLDGSRAPGIPASAHSTLAQWDEALTHAINGSDTVVVFGMDTVEEGESHNSMLFWTKEGNAGWYHKRRLVPFAEYQPALLRRLGVRGASQFAPGHGPRIVNVHGLALGAFICQEVLYPSVLRETVRAGADLLVSGGNDGVFADRAVAEIHDRVVRLRAVETGRYIVRAMKTGVSAIVDPTGHELARSVGQGSMLLRGQVEALHGWTPYMRFGDWPLLLACLLIVGVGAWRRATLRREISTRCAS